MDGAIASLTDQILYIEYIELFVYFLRSVQDSLCAGVGWSILGDDLNSRD
jgi:hypothetical protein